MPAKQVFDDTTFLTTTQTLTGGGTVVVEQGAYIFTSSNEALKFDVGPWKVEIDGGIQGAAQGMTFSTAGLTPAAKNGTVTVGTDGVITAVTNAAIEAATPM